MTTPADETTIQLFTPDKILLVKIGKSSDPHALKLAIAAAVNFPLVMIHEVLFHRGEDKYEIVDDGNISQMSENEPLSFVLYNLHHGGVMSEPTRKLYNASISLVLN